MSNKTFPLALVAAMLLISLFLYPFLPEYVAVHWNIQGNPDGMAHKAVAVLFAPVITLLLLGLFRGILGGRFQQQYGTAGETHSYIINVILLFLGFIHVLTLLVALRPELSIIQAIGVGMGGLFALLGNVMGRLRPNPYFGFRMPWTMTDDEVWRRTHRTGGRWMVISGILIMLAALVLPPELFFVVMMGLMLGSTLWTVYYSRRLWLERHRTAS